MKSILDPTANDNEIDPFEESWNNKSKMENKEVNTTTQKKNETVKYSCGHGTHEIELTGDAKRDAFKIQWYETNYSCPECFKLKTGRDVSGTTTNKFKDNDRECTVNCSYKKDETCCYLEFIAEGKLHDNSDSLKSIGFRWEKTTKVDEETKNKYVGWVMKCVYKITSIDEMKSFIEQFKQELDKIGYKLYTDMFAMPVQQIVNDIEELNKGKPEYNGCYDFIKEEHGLVKFNAWNGKIYSSYNDGYFYYLDNTKHPCTENQYLAYKDYENAVDNFYNRKKNLHEDYSNSTYNQYKYVNTH